MCIQLLGVIFMNILHKHIRRICLKDILFALIPLVIFSIPLFVLPFSNIFSPTILDSPKDFEKHALNGEQYVEITFPKLHYTGYNLVTRFNTKGYYYYYIKDEKVYFALITGKDKTPDEVITNYTCRGKLAKRDADLRNVISNFANDIDFTVSGIYSVACPYLLNEAAYNLQLYKYLFIYEILVITAIAVFILINLIMYAIPELHPAFFKFRHITVGVHTKDVLRELSHYKARAGRIFFTKNYLVAFPKNDIIILPLDQIMWVYEHSTIHKLFFRARITYHLHFIAQRNISASMTKCSADDIALVTEYLSTKYPDILLGYTQEIKQEIKHKTLKKKISKKGSET